MATALSPSVTHASLLASSPSHSYLSRARLPVNSFCGLRSGQRSRLAKGTGALSSASTARRDLSVVAEATGTAVGAVTDSTFKSLVLESDVPVVVDFWAPWCGPCRMIDPLVQELATLYSGKVKVYKLNTDESPQVATEYGIRSIPTVMVFKRGKKVDTVIGAVPKSTLTSTIDKYL